MAQGNLAAEWGWYDGDTGYAAYTPTTVKRLTGTPAAGVTLPADAVHALIFVLDNPVSIKIDSTTDATAAAGGVWPTGHIERVENNRRMLKRLSFIDTSAGASRVRVIYGRMPGGLAE